ncbi:MAG: glycosyltransferase family 4 protein [Chloroflexota bacterium]
MSTDIQGGEPAPAIAAADGRSARFVTHSPPSPGISGDRIRVYNLVRALKDRGWTVRVWSLLGPDEPAGSTDALRAIADELVLVPLDVTARRRRLRLIRDAVARRPLQSHWFWSKATAHEAARWLADADEDALFVEQLYMLPFVPARLWRQSALDTQNHEAARMRTIASSGGGLGRRAVARSQIGPVTTYERAAVRSVGRVLAVSEDEFDAFERMSPGQVRLVANGVDAEAIVPVTGPPASRELLFLGSLGYGANVDAVRHFVIDVAPLLQRSGAALTVVGSNPSPSVYRDASRAPLPVTVTGYAPDLGPHYSGSRAMIVPLRHGGGTRLKILEALAWGLPVVTTSLGGAGLGLVDGRHALIADDPRAFASAVERLLDDDALWLALSRAGRAFVEEHFDWQRIGTTFEAVMLELAVAARPTRRLASP